MLHLEYGKRWNQSSKKKNRRRSCLSRLRLLIYNELFSNSLNSSNFIGNSCFSFLTPIFDDSLPLDSKKVNNKILLQALKTVDIEAEFSGRNDILYQGKKVKLLDIIELYLIC